MNVKNKRYKATFLLGMYTEDDDLEEAEKLTMVIEAKTKRSARARAIRFLAGKMQEEGAQPEIKMCDAYEWADCSECWDYLERECNCSPRVTFATGCPVSAVTLYILEQTSSDEPLTPVKQQWYLDGDEMFRSCKKGQMHKKRMDDVMRLKEPGWQYKEDGHLIPPKRAGRYSVVLYDCESEVTWITTAYWDGTCWLPHKPKADDDYHMLLGWEDYYVIAGKYKS